MSTIEFGFGNTKEPIPLNLSERDLGKWKQVHGTDSTYVQKQGQICGEVDALITRESGIAVSVRTADCVPVLLGSERHGVVMAIHAGWRGTYARIIEKVWTRLDRHETDDPSSWRAWIGPSIRNCCYEVSEDLFQKFRLEFPDVPHSKKNYLDLAEINLTVLKSLGINNVENLAECTYCTEESGVYKFNSFRRESSNLRQFSVIRILPESVNTRK